MFHPNTSISFSAAIWISIKYRFPAFCESFGKNSVRICMKFESIFIGIASITKLSYFFSPASVYSARRIAPHSSRCQFCQALISIRRGICVWANVCIRIIPSVWIANEGMIRFFLSFKHKAPLNQFVLIKRNCIPSNSKSYCFLLNISWEYLFKTYLIREKTVSKVLFVEEIPHFHI